MKQMGLGRRRPRLVSAIVCCTVVGTMTLGAAPAGAATTRATGHAKPDTFVPTSHYTVPSPPTASEVNTGVANAVNYIDFQQNQTPGPAFGSFGNSGSGDVPETAAAIIAYGTLDKGNIANLPTSVASEPCLAGPDPGTCPKHNYQTDLTNAVTWMLGQQNTTAPASNGVGGSWVFEDEFYTYSTGLALVALSLSATVPEPTGAIATAIANGRAFLENDFEGLANSAAFNGGVPCSSANTSATASWCGGWNYEPEPIWGSPRSDESNTGYAISGLALTGGVPADIQAVNLGWQNNIQADTATNPNFAGTNNDGGGSYQPAYVSEIGFEFTSEANDSGSEVFGMKDDGLPITDPRVDTGLQFDEDVLDTYEMAAHPVSGSAEYQMVEHDHASEDGSCDPAVGGCDWGFDGDGGFHYSLFALSKAMGGYISPNLADPTNWYTKIADLLLGQQDTDPDDTDFGAWPPNGRDDFSELFATGLSVFALGLVAVPPPPVTKVSTVTESPVCNQVTFNWTNPATPNYGGVYIQRSTTGFPATSTDGTRVAAVAAPKTTFTDTDLVSGTKYYYAIFAYDTSGAAASSGVDVTATPVCETAGYRLEGGDGGVFSFSLPFDGSVPHLGLHIGDATGMAAISGGYWLVERSGGVFSFGAAHFHGSIPQTDTAIDDIVGIASTPDGGGYWLVASDGTVYPFGNAGKFNSLSSLGIHVNDIVAIVSDGAGGYWLVGADGGVFSFGGAVYHGSCPHSGSGCQKLAAPIVGGASDDAGGYWLAGADGGVFSFGDATYHGSCPHSGSSCMSLAAPIVGIASPDLGGYWLAGADGGVFTFGDAKFDGSCPQTGSGCEKLVRPVVAIT